MVDKFVDEDWKKRAQAEKEALSAKERREEPARAAGGPGPAAKPQPHPAFPMLLQQLATQALFHLGLINDGSGIQHPPEFENARAAIGLLEVLELKMRGNLTRDEELALRDTLQEVRMAFVEVSRGGGAPRGPEPGA
jgi:hypothetical protein